MLSKVDSLLSTIVGSRIWLNAWITDSSKQKPLLFTLSLAAPNDVRTVEASNSCSLVLILRKFASDE